MLPTFELQTLVKGRKTYEESYIKCSNLRYKLLQFYESLTKNNFHNFDEFNQNLNFRRL